MNARHPGCIGFVALVAALSGASLAQAPAPMPRGAPAASAPSTAELRPGDGIGGVDVGIRKRPGGQTAATTRTDAQGHFTFANLAAGSYDLVVTRPAQPSPTAKSFFESRSNTAKVAVTLRSGTSGATRPLAWTWAPASGELVGGDSPGAMRGMSPPAGQQGAQKSAVLDVSAGDTVTGQVTTLTVVKSKSNITNN